LVARSICQVLAGAESGGLERHFVDLCNALAGRHQVTAIAHPLHADAFSDAVRFVPLDLAASRFDPRRLLQLYRALREAMPDLVHTHANKATSMVALLKPWLSMSFVATLHNEKSRVSMFRACDGVIAVSAALAACLPKREVTIIPNGIAPPAPVAAEAVAGLRAHASHARLALAAGRLVPAKGFDLLLQAWGGIDAELWIAGEGPERARLQTLIDALQLADRVRLLGQRADMDALLEAADLLVLPSRREGFPYVLIEALHHRRPVVATRVAGAVDVLPAHWLAPVEDARALHALLARALDAPDELRRDFEPVWQYAQRELSLPAMVEHTEAFYRKVLRG
jgi:glycosyltransferase involved in cell wall biosynthesis